MIVSDLIETTLPTEELFLVLYCVIDELYQEVAPERVRLRLGSHRVKMTDPQIICLSVMQEGRSNDSELSFHRLIQKDYRRLFPQLVSRSRYHPAAQGAHGYPAPDAAHSDGEAASSRSGA